MHLLFPYEVALDPEGSRRHQLKAKAITFFSPPSSSTSDNRRFLFSLFYVTTHVFAFANTLVYWGVQVPAGHGGFRPPSFHQSDPGSNATVMYDPSELDR